MSLLHEPRRILVLAGAAATPSRTRAVAELVCREVTAAGSRPILRDLGHHPLPLLDTGSGASDDPRVEDLLAQTSKADALVWVTPCYHGSYSGVIKNCLDHLRADDLRGKPVGVVVTGASLAAVQACEHLRAVARTLGCVTTPTQTVVVNSGPLEGSTNPGAAEEPEARLRIARMIDEVHALSGATYLLKKAVEADRLSHTVDFAHRP